MNIVIRFAILLLFTFGLVGCASDHRVPVQEAWRQPLRVPVLYTVQSGDSLYTIAFLYGIDYRSIAAVNHIKSPYHIHPGQQLKLAPSNDMRVVSTAAKSQTSARAVTANKNFAQAPMATTPVVMGAEVKNNGITWMWPARGNLVDNFAGNGVDKGIDIFGKAGTPVVAAASGKVVYAGSGLPGYGELIIIKHNSDFLSAYAHNQKLLVQEGQKVKVGQMIATMGNTDAKQVMLHFEIRQIGKPVDPLKYLPPR